MTPPIKIPNLMLGLLFFSVFAHGAWAESGKLFPVKADRKWMQTVTLAQLNLDLPQGDPRLSIYGGSMDSGKREATGFFRTEKIDGAWMLIDPLGYPFICMGVNSIAIRGDTLKARYEAVFASSGEWLRHVDDMMKDLGFNTYANWCDHEQLKPHQRPYCNKVNFIASYAKGKGSAKMGYGHFLFENNVMPVFDPEFEAYANQQAKALSKSANDPFLIGMFSDNELPFSGIEGIIGNYLKMGPDDAGHQRAKQWLQERRIGEKDITADHDEQFMDLVIERYFSIVGKVMKAHLPNHLYLGTRFHGRALNDDSLFEISGKYVDVVSANYYHRWTPEYHRINKWAELAGKPLMMTEFYAKARIPGITNSKGAGIQVDTQQDRAYFYENYTLGLLRNPNVVGWNYFRYADDLEAGVESNKGIVNRDFEIYPQSAKSMRAINKSAYALRRQLLRMKSPLLLGEPVVARGVESK